ncbi:MAG: membrane-bound lytic murein transglycosylase MltF [Bacteriovoracaceae bacterium]|nr:membrane-bound lytic murein transglycosylase MltF [Bacteriovoracaceae bacterium]
MNMKLKIILFIICFSQLSCKQMGPQNLEELQQTGEIVVLTRNSPTTYYEDKDGQMAGLEYELARSFGAYLGVKVRFKTITNLQEMLQFLANGEGDFAAAGLAITDSRSQRFLFGPAYQTVQQQVVCHKDLPIKEMADLAKVKTVVVKGSSYEENIKDVMDKANIKMNVVPSFDMFSEELLKNVEDGSVECTVADNHIINLHRRFFENIRVKFDLGKSQSLAWALPKSKKYLQTEMRNWFVRVEKSGELHALLDKYYTYADDFDLYDTKVFLTRMKSRLPKFQELFKEAGERYKIDWKLIAAVSYQESHWNPWAQSHTGVKGLMMLTNNTAKQLGVVNRVDPLESIDGGARYLKMVIDRIPAHVQAPDRLWMALASYNVGYLHLRDACMLTVWMDKNAQIWSDVKTHLPFLANKKYHYRLPHGYARGWEPVAYVQRIRNYYDLLAEHVD